MSNLTADQSKAKSICVLNCEDHPRWIQYNIDLLGDSFLVKSFDAFKSEWPPEEEIVNFDGFIITGSLSAAYEDESIVPGTWVPQFGRRVSKLVKSVLDNNAENVHKQYILGICFGHQIIAHYCGGKGRKMTTPQYGLQPQIIDSSFFELSYIQKALDLVSSEYPDEVEGLRNGKMTFAPIETHGDEVCQLPTGATLLTHSENTPIESFTIGNSVLCTQFHPEFTGTIVANELIPHICARYPDYTIPPPTTTVPEYLQAPSSSLSKTEHRFTPAPFTHCLLTAIVRQFLLQ